MGGVCFRKSASSQPNFSIQVKETGIKKVLGESGGIEFSVNDEKYAWRNYNLILSYSFNHNQLICLRSFNKGWTEWHFLLIGL